MSKKYNLSFPVISKEQICISTDEKSILNFGIKIGDHILMTNDAHGKRHWIDSFNKVNRNSIHSLENIIDTSEKENQQILSPSKTNQTTRLSISKMNDSHFSLTLKKSFLKQKRNSIGYI